MDSPSEGLTIKGFIPIEVSDSPLSSGGQLTGIPRKVRDNAADFYNIIQEFDRLHENGFEIINEMKSLKFPGGSRTLEEENKYPLGLQKLCDKLQVLHDKLEDFDVKLQVSVSQFESLQKLFKVNSPIYSTWMAEKFVRVGRSIWTAYHRECNLKQHIIENIPDVTTMDEFRSFELQWAQQPYISMNLHILMTYMLAETEHI